jgi:hypothetical protein
MFKPLEILLRRIVEHGDLSLITHDGKTFRFGDGEGPAVVARLADRKLERQLALDPHLAVGEAYMDGRLIMEQGRIYDLLALVLENAMAHPPPRWAQTLDVARFLTRRLAQFNPTSRSRRNVAHHYDIGFSLPIASTPAPTSTIRTRLWRRRRKPRSATSPRSSHSRKGNTFWISAQVGAASASISLNRPAALLMA